MDDLASGKPAATSQQPTVASVLGIKGPLRFHPHGSTQKAHVVLRQVELSDDSDDEGDGSTIYFSLFAQKRIEVKPGKEILLAVAAPDGNLLEAPVILAARVSGGEEVELDPPAAHSGVEVTVRPPSVVLPPKLRKLWNGGSKVENVVPQSAPSPQRVFASIGVQVEPSIVPSDLVSPSPLPLPVPTPALQTPTEKRTQCVGTDPEGDPPNTTPTEAADMSAVTVSTSPSIHKSDDSSNRERSLSPMELDSPPSSPPPPSPAPLPAVPTIAERPKSTSFSPPGLWVSTVPEVKAQTAENGATAAPYHWSPDGGDPPGLSLLPLGQGPGATPVVDEKPPSETPNSSTHGEPDVAAASQPTGVPNKPQEGITPSSGSPQDTSSKPATPAPYVPKRKTVPNPFVSGGLLTDFVSGTGAKGSASTPSTPTPLNDAASTQPTTPAPPTPLTPATSIIDTPSLSVGASASSSSSPPARTRSPLAPSSPASSSKMKIEDFPVQPDFSRPAEPSVLPNGFRPIPSGPPHALPPFAPNLPGQRRFGPASVQSNGPPTEPKTLAPAPPTFTNPLGIRPSSVNNWARIKPGTPAVPPEITAKPGNKKPVPIGNGWPHSRQANANPVRQSFRRASLPKQEQVVRNALYNSLPGSPMQSDHIPAGADITSPSNMSNGFNNMYPGVPRSDSWSPSEVPIPLEIAVAKLETSPLDKIGISSPTSATTPTSTASSNHPLPIKPLAYKGPVDDGWSPTRGVKRMGSPVQHTTDPRRIRSFKWPVSDGLHTSRLRGDDDVGIRSICYSRDGNLFAVVAFDKSVRIWSNKTRSEVAKLAHNMQITAVAWMERDAGVVTLGDNGIVSTWTRSAANKWQWAKILDASGGRGDDKPCCLAFGKDRMAIAYPRTGVKVWLFIQGSWRPQRTIVRQNVTAIHFVEEGNALIGGTTDGVLWYCEVPNGTLRAYAFMKNKVYALDVDPKTTHVLAAQIGGRSHLVNIAQDDKKGKVEQVYSVKDADLQTGVSYDFGALFASRGKALLFGVTRGCIMVWDRASGEIVHGLNHGEDHVIQAVACYDGSQATDGHVLTGTRDGELTWFSQPTIDGAATRNGAW